MPASLTPDFSKAAEESKKLKAKPSDSELLQLYAHFKQGSQDPPFAEAAKPGTFDFKGKAKYNAWQEVKDMSPEDAQRKYAEIVGQMKEKYGFDG